MPASDSTKLFRDAEGNIKSLLNEAEGISFQESPLDFFILLARYKFAAKLLKKADTVADVGCGHGLGSVFLSKFAKQVTGLDYDQAMIETNRISHAKNKSINFECFDLLKPTTEYGTFDAIVSMDVIEHFHQHQIPQVVKSYRSLVKPSGFAVIGTPNSASAPYASARRKATHLHEMGPDEFQEVLSKEFGRVFMFSMTDEVVSTSFSKMAWFLIGVCVP